MKKILISTLILCGYMAQPATARPYQPHWSKVFETNDYVAYIDETSRQDGPTQVERPVTIEMTAVIDFKTPQAIEGESVLSIVTRWRFDCVNRDVVRITDSSFDSHLGGGNMVYMGSDSGDWAKPQSGALNEVLWSYTCNKNH